MEYKYYVEEIEVLKKAYKLAASEVLMLQIAAAYECNSKSYDELKKEFCKK